MTTGIDWAGLMRAGLQGLGLEPAAFWRLTPAELRIMLGVERAAPPLTRARLEELAAAFPDVTRGTEDGGCRGTDRGAGGAGGTAGRHGPDGGSL
ncbi:MAG: phage tail assembly chaperone [Rhodobacteraceae bacterium]|nr:phage tail assembly chaperone [Paracoccaceae bacterium]